MTDEQVERGAAEEMSDAPLTDTEVTTAARRPASEPATGSEPSRTGVDAAGVEQDAGDA